MSWDLNVNVEQNNWDIEVVDGQAIINLTVEGQNTSLALQAANDAQQSALAADQSAISSFNSAQDAQDSADSALLSEQNASQSASNALQSEQNAAQSEQAALLSEQNASQSAQDALFSEQNASQSAQDALQSANNALQSEQNAAQSAQDAQDSADLAQQYAESIDVLGTVLDGFTVGANSTILSTDTVLGAFGKVQGQINNIPVQDPVTIGTGNGLSLSGQQLSLGLSSSTTNGALSSTDWTTFNNKQNTLSLTTIGNSGASTLVGATLNIPNYTLSGLGGIGGTLATGQVAFGSGTNTIGGSNNLFWDNANGRLGIGTNNPQSRLSITDSSTLFTQRLVNTSANGRAGILMVGNSTGYAGFASYGSSFAAPLTNGTTFFSSHNFYISANDLGNVNGFISFTQGAGLTLERMRIAPTTGNILINTTTDAGFRLDVNGTARVQGQLTTAISGSGTVLDVFTNGVAYNPLTITNSGSTFRSNGTNASLVANDFSVSSSGVGIRGRRASHLFNINKSFGIDSFGIYDGGTSIPDFLIKNNGNVLLGTSTDVASSILTLESTTKGFLPPRMTSAQRDAIASPAAGLIVYNTTDNKLSWYNGTVWANL